MLKLASLNFVMVKKINKLYRFCSVNTNVFSDFGHDTFEHEKIRFFGSSAVNFFNKMNLNKHKQINKYLFLNKCTFV